MMMLRRVFSLLLVVGLAALINMGLFSTDIAQAAKSPKYSIKFVAPLKSNRTKSNQIKKAVSRFVQAYPEVPTINLKEILVVQNNQINAYCSGTNAIACYNPNEQRIVLLSTSSEDTTIYHELFHASMVDSAGSSLGAYADSVEEGMAEFMSLRMTSYARPAYANEVQVITSLVEALGMAAGEATANGQLTRGIEELRKLMFVEGRQSGVDARLAPYTVYGDVYATLNAYLQQKEYGKALNWLVAIKAKIKANPPGTSTPVDFPAKHTLIATGKVVRPSESSPKADVLLFWRVQEPQNAPPYSILVFNHGAYVATLSGDDAKKGTYTFPVTLPYTAGVDIQVRVPVSEGSADEIVAAQQLLFNAVLTNNDQSANTNGGTGTSSGTSDRTGTGGSGGTSGGGAGSGSSSSSSTTKPETVSAVEAINFSSTGNSVLIHITKDAAGVESKSVTLNWSVTGNPEPGRLRIRIVNTRGQSIDYIYANNKRSGSETKLVYEGASIGPGGNFKAITFETPIEYHLYYKGKKISGLRLTPINSEATVSTQNPINQAANKGPCYTFEDTLFGKNICAPQYFRRFYFWAVGLAIAGAIATIVYAGYKITVSKNNPSEVKNGKEIVVSTLVGLVLLLLSYTILQFLGIPLK